MPAAKPTSPKRTNTWPRSSVAVLDVKNHEFTTLDRASAEQKDHKKVPLPRWKSKTPVYLSENGGDKLGYVATVHLNRLGVMYNAKRLFGMGEELYVLCDKTY